MFKKTDHNSNEENTNDHNNNNNNNYNTQAEEKAPPTGKGSQGRAYLKTDTKERATYRKNRHRQKHIQTTDTACTINNDDVKSQFETDIPNEDDALVIIISKTHYPN